MPTVTESKTNEDAKAQPVPPVSNEPELFAAEVEMQGKHAGFMPLLLIAGLILVVGGTIFYFVKGARDVLTVPVASSTVTRLLGEQGPATIRFSTGTVLSTVNEKPQDPHYKLLAKTGYLDQLEGAQIPLIARLLAVADAFSAMTTTRPYRKAYSVDESLTRLEDSVGTQLDEELVRAFVLGIRTAEDPPLPDQDARRARIWTPIDLVA